MRSLLTFCVALAACASPAPAARCEFGRVQACPCAGGPAGTQECRPPGVWSVCACPTGDGGADAPGVDARASDDANAPDVAPADAAPDAATTDARRPSDAFSCVPGAATCADPHVRRVCDGDGAGFTMTSCAFGTVCIGAGTCVTYPEVVMASRPAAYWRFEEGGPTATDEVARLAATATSGVTFGPGGIRGGRGLTLRGAGTLEVPYRAALNAPAFSVEVWARVAGSSGGYRSAFTSRDAPPARGYSLYVDDANHWNLFVGAGTSASWQPLADTDVVTMDRLYHVVATFDAGAARLYVNGTLRASRDDVALAPNVTRGARIGAGQTENVTPDYHFDGALDELALYARALTAAEVADHWSVGSAL